MLSVSGRESSGACLTLPANLTHVEAPIDFQVASEGWLKRTLPGRQGP